MHLHFQQELVQLLERFVSQNKKELIDGALQHRTRYLTVVLENIQKPHNASAVLRTVECMGLQDFYMIEADKQYAVNPGIVKGAIKWIDIARFGEAATDNTSVCIAALKEKGYAIAVTSPHAEGYYPEQLPLDKPIALFFGNEQEGVSQQALQAADYHVRIPMWGFTESYNLSVSASICVYTIMQRLRGSNLNWRLTEEEQQTLRLEWYRKLVRRADLLEEELQRRYVH